MSDIRKELEAATNIKKKKSEDEQSYYARLSSAVQKLPEDAWESLSEPAQVWCNKSLKAADADKELPDFPDDEEVEEAEVTADDEEEVTTTKAKGKANGAGKKEKVAKEPKEPSMRRTIKQLIVKDPTITIEDLNTKLKSSGFNPAKTTVASIRSDTLDTMKVLKDSGQLGA